MKKLIIIFIVFIFILICTTIIYKKNKYDYPTYTYGKCVLVKDPICGPGISMNITEEEVAEINIFDDFIGQKLYIRTVTYHSVGKVEKMIGTMIELSNASWIPDSGRFMQAIKDGVLKEVEPVGRMWLNRDTIIDVFPWKHKLPTEQKYDRSYRPAPF